jgi:hypothetical protein
MMEIKSWKQAKENTFKEVFMVNQRSWQNTKNIRNKKKA